MIVMIAGPRDLMIPVSTVEQAVLNSGFAIDVHVNGMADGVDRCARRWAIDKGIYIIPLDARWEFWRRLGNVKQAGPERNEIGSRIADGLIVIRRRGAWSKGTKSVYNYFAGKPTHIEFIDEGDEV
jgi:hypothetical protein